MCFLKVHWSFLEGHGLSTFMIETSIEGVVAIEAFVKMIRAEGVSIRAAYALNSFFFLSNSKSKNP